MMGTLVMRNELGSLESGLKDLKRSRVSPSVKDLKRSRVGPRGQTSLLSLTFVIFEILSELSLINTV